MSPSVKYLLAAILCFLAVPVHAQSSFEIAGSVQDTTGVPLSGATVVLLQRADSVMVSFGITRDDGTFAFRRVRNGEYLLHATFVGYASISRDVDVSGSDLQLDPVFLTPTVEELQELTVSADHIPMIVKKDTLEYNAAAFNVRPNAMVEDLLKRLPGIEVESDGTVKAMGEDVQKVLVDGKEFFGDDYKIATKNLPADAVDRVQLYDKMSETAEFTGIDDGEREKTINLALKEDKKQGYFGNVNVGYGPDSRYQGRFSLNRFTPQTQISTLGNVNNINEQGFSFGDYISFMGGMSAFSGGMALTVGQGGGGIPIGQGMSNGFRTTSTGGINVSHDFTSKTSLTLSYFANWFKNDQSQTSQTQQFLESNNSILSTELNNSLSRNLNHRVNFRGTHKFDESQDVIIRSNISATDNSMDAFRDQETFGVEDELENTAVANTDGSGDNFSLNGEVTYRKRISENGRSFVAEAGVDNGMRDDLTNFESVNTFYSGLLDPVEEAILQRQILDNTDKSYNGSLTYTEPWMKNSILEFNVERRKNQTDERKDVFDEIGDSEVLNALLSDRYERDYTFNRGGVSVRYLSNGHNVTAGLRVQQSELNGSTDLSQDDINKSYVNYLPLVSWRYSISQMRNINARYEANVREPSMRELQPVPDNTNPLNLYLGNPDLQPERNHSLNLHYMSFDQFTFTNFFAFLRAQYTTSKIVQAQTIDELFRQTRQPVNAGDDWTIFGNASFGTPLRALGTKINLSSNVFYQTGNAIVNDQTGNTQIFRGSIETRLENRNKDVIDASVGARLTYNGSSYELSNGQDQSYIDQRYFAEITAYIGDSWTFNTGMDYTRYSQEAFGSSQNVPIWRAEITRSMLDNRAQLQLSVYDILNQNLGISRTSTLNYIRDERVQSLGRFILFKFIYSLSGTGGAGKGRGPNVIMHTVGG